MNPLSSFVALKSKSLIRIRMILLSRLVALKSKSWIEIRMDSLLALLP